MVGRAEGRSDMAKFDGGGLGACGGAAESCVTLTDEPAFRGMEASDSKIPPLFRRSNSG